MIPQSLQFILFCVQKIISYQIVVRLSKRLFLSMTLSTSLVRRTSWLVYILIVVLIYNLKLVQKSDRSSENRNTFRDPVKNSSAFAATIKLTVPLMSSIALISYWTRTVSGTWFQHLLCNSITLMIDTLCPIITLNQQLTNLEQTHIRCFLHCALRTMDSKRKGLSVSFGFFQKNYLPDGRVNETVATVEDLSDLWKPGAMDGIPPFVMTCSCF